MHEKDVTLDVSLLDLIEIANPVECPPWCTIPPLSRKDVELCILNSDTDERRLEPYNPEYEDPWYHAQRIAYLYLHLDKTPIEIDLNKEYWDRWIVIDGNHRLYAAILRKDLTIRANISGFIDMIPELLPNTKNDVSPDHSH